jgi:fructokinase
MTKTIVAFGEALWDLLPTGPQLGGAPCNFAFRARELGSRAVLVTRLGRDELGRKAHDRLSALGMDISQVQWDERRPTGTVDVLVDKSGSPDFTIHRDVAYDFIEASTGLRALARVADCIAFGTLTQRSDTSRGALQFLLKESGETVRFLDINLRKDCYTDGTVLWSIQHSDVLKLNEGEVDILRDTLGLKVTGICEFCDALVSRYAPAYCVVTLGERGVYAASRKGERVHVPGYKIDVVDTCGAGDALSAGFVHGLLAGKPLVECCALGNILGSIVAGQPGATTPIPRGMIEDFGRQGRDRIGEPSLDRFRSV